VPGTIGYGDTGFPVLFCQPEKVSADNVPGLENEEEFPQQFFKHGIRRKHGTLNPLGIADAVQDLLLLV